MAMALAGGAVVDDGNGEGGVRDGRDGGGGSNFSFGNEPGRQLHHQENSEDRNTHNPNHELLSMHMPIPVPVGSMPSDGDLRIWQIAAETATMADSVTDTNNLGPMDDGMSPEGARRMMAENGIGIGGGGEICFLEQGDWSTQPTTSTATTTTRPFIIHAEQNPISAAATSETSPSQASASTEEEVTNPIAAFQPVSGDQTPASSSDPAQSSEISQPPMVAVDQQHHQQPRLNFAPPLFPRPPPSLLIPNTTTLNNPHSLPSSLSSLLPALSPTASSIATPTTPHPASSSSPSPASSFSPSVAPSTPFGRGMLLYHLTPAGMREKLEAELQARHELNQPQLRDHIGILLAQVERNKQNHVPLQFSRQSTTTTIPTEANSTTTTTTTTSSASQTSTVLIPTTMMSTMMSLATSMATATPTATPTSSASTKEKVEDGRRNSETGGKADDTSSLTSTEKSKLGQETLHAQLLQIQKEFNEKQRARIDRERAMRCKKTEGEIKEREQDSGKGKGKEREKEKEKVTVTDLDEDEDEEEEEERGKTKNNKDQEKSPKKTKAIEGTGTIKLAKKSRKSNSKSESEASTPTYFQPLQTEVEGEQPEGLSQSSLRKMKIPQLQDLLRQRGLQVSGKKSVLIQRLLCGVSGPPRKRRRGSDFHLPATSSSSPTSTSSSIPPVVDGDQVAIGDGEEGNVQQQQMDAEPNANSAEAGTNADPQASGDATTGVHDVVDLETGTEETATQQQTQPAAMDGEGVSTGTTPDDSTGTNAAPTATESAGTAEMNQPQQLWQRILEIDARIKQSEEAGVKSQMHKVETHRNSVISAIRSGVKAELQYKGNGAIRLTYDISLDVFNAIFHGVGTPPSNPSSAGAIEKVLDKADIEKLFCPISNWSKLFRSGAAIRVTPVLNVSYSLDKGQLVVEGKYVLESDKKSSTSTTDKKQKQGGKGKETKRDGSKAGGKGKKARHGTKRKDEDEEEIGSDKEEDERDVRNVSIEKASDPLEKNAEGQSEHNSTEQDAQTTSQQIPDAETAKAKDETNMAGNEADSVSSTEANAETSNMSTEMELAQTPEERNVSGTSGVGVDDAPTGIDLAEAGFTL